MVKRSNTIRLTEEAWEALQRLASRDGRSMSSWVEWTVRQKAHEVGAWAPKPVSDTTKVSKR